MGPRGVDTDPKPWHRDNLTCEVKGLDDDSPGMLCFDLHPERKVSFFELIYDDGDLISPFKRKPVN